MAEDTETIFQSLSEDFGKGDLDDVGKRRRLAAKARRLVSSLETDHDIVLDMFFGPLEGNCLKIMMDLGLLKALVDNGNTRTAAQLAEQANTKLDATLLDRLLRFLASYGYVDRLSDGYQANRSTRALAKDEAEYGAAHSVGFLYDGYNKLSEHLKRTNWENPRDAKKSAISLAKNMDGRDIFEILAVDPAREKTNKWFRCVSAQYTPWIRLYPFLERVSKASAAEVQFVDIGGNLGHQTILLKEANQQLPGKFIVQDLTSTVSANPHLAELGIEFQSYNFYDEQPVKGAACYYMRYITHDWGDAETIKILTRVREAMKAGYSKLLIDEWIVPEQGASRLVTGTDLAMMVAGSGMERTLAQFMELIDKAGLKIEEVFYPTDEISPAVIETVVI